MRQCAGYVRACSAFAEGFVMEVAAVFIDGRPPIGVTSQKTP